MLEKDLSTRSNLAYEEESDKINPRLTAQSKIFKKHVYKSGENVYTAVGWDVETPVMVEGTDGIIIIDPTESHDSMAEVMAEFRKVTDKPVTGIIITHHHPDHWGGIGACTSQAEVNAGKCVVIAQDLFEYNVARMTGILADIKIGRALYMYGHMLPEGEEGRVNLGLGPMMRTDTQDYIPPTTTFDKEYKVTISGVDFEMFHIPSECVDEICVWMPKERVLHVAEAIQGENFPNLYSIRGSNRDPLKWIKSVDFMRQFPAEYLVGNHMRPVEGATECADHLRDYRDMMQYVHDQTVRLINKGLTPDNIIKELKQLPPHLYQRPRMGEHYGTFIQAIKLVFSTHVGWFNGDAATLDPVTPSESAANYVRLIGRDKILEEGRNAIEAKNYKWAAEILSNLIKADHNDMEARHLKATALRNLGYLTENGPFRNWYMTQAMNLDGHFEAVKKAIPEFNGPGVYFKAINLVPAQFIWDCVTVKLNGPMAATVETALTIDLSDCGVAKDLEIRKGVLQVHEAGTFNTIGKISLPKEAFILIFTKLKTVEEVNEMGLINTELPIETVSKFFSYFDGFTPLFDMEFPFE